MDRSCDTVVKELEMGFVPYEFTFNLEPRCLVDWTKLKYNDWEEDDFWLARMPEGLLEQFPCLFEWALSTITEEQKKTTPLMEIEKRGGLVAPSLSDQ